MNQTVADGNTFANTVFKLSDNNSWVYQLSPSGQVAGSYLALFRDVLVSKFHIVLYCSFGTFSPGNSL